MHGSSPEEHHLLQQPYHHIADATMKTHCQILLGPNGHQVILAGSTNNRVLGSSRFPISIDALDS